ncbi:unnamed protein product, partial [Tetraodon nigroviridis]
LEIQLKESEELQKQLEKRILEVEQMKQQEQETRRRAIDELEKHVSDLQRSLKASQAKEQEALERTAAAVTLEQKAIQDSLLQTKLAAEAQAKYERELMLHAADVEAIQELKKKAEEEAVKKKELEIQVAKASSVLQEKVAAWNLVERQLKMTVERSELETCQRLNKKIDQLEAELVSAKTKLEQEVAQKHKLGRSMDARLLEVRKQLESQNKLYLKTKELLLSSEQQAATLKAKLATASSSEPAAATGPKLQLRVCIRRLIGNFRLYKLVCLCVPAPSQGSSQADKELQEVKGLIICVFTINKATTRTLAAQERQLKKIEDIKVLQETNRMLKMDKEKLEQELLQTQARVTKLQSDISPLHHSMSILSEKIGSLQADKKLLEEDLKRWKTKTQQLISQQKESETEERQKIASERRDQQRNISQLVEETTNLKNELARSTASCNSAQSQLQNLRDSVTHLTAERDALKKDLETKNNDILEKNKTITQVKKIGRRYKSQYEELKIQHDKLVEDMSAKTKSATGLNQEVNKADEELVKVKEELNKLKEEAKKPLQELKEALKENQEIKDKLKDIQNQLIQKQNQLDETQNQLKSMQSQAQDSHGHIQQLQGELQQAKEALQRSLDAQKELQQSHSQEVTNLKAAVSQAEIKVTKLQEDLDSLQKLCDGKNREEQLKKQIAEKDEKTKKVFLGAKTKISQLSNAKVQLSQEMEELKQSKKELEVRMNALKSQYEGRLHRLERELRELRDARSHHSELSEEPQDQVGVKTRSSEQRKISLKSPAHDRGSSSLSEPPTANIRPTPSTQSPGSKSSPSPGSKATPRASIRPMVTPTVPVPTPTATVMPTTQAESQEVVINSGPSGSTQLPAITAPSSIQTTAFVQPTQQQVGFSVDMEQPSTSSFIGPGKPDPCQHFTSWFKARKRGRRLNLKRLRRWTITESKQMSWMTISLNEDEESIEQDGTSQSVPSDPLSSQNFIIAETDSSSCESKLREKHPNICEEAQQEEDGDEEIKAEEMCEVDNAGDRGTRRSEDGHIASKQSSEEGREGKHADTPHTEDTSDPGRPSEEAPSGEGTSSAAASESSLRKDPAHLVLSSSPSTISSSSPSLPQPRRTSHPLPPRLYIQPPPPELHFQRHPLPLPRPSGGRGPQLTPGVGSMQHFFDDEDRMVPSTPTLVVPHRTDGFAEAIHSPQVAGLSTSFRFGLPDDVLSQASASHSDLGQLASQGGLGMYESPLFLAAHDEDGGGRSVPTTPLQLAAPVTVFTESLPSDGAESVTSQSVPMVSAAAGVAAAADERDEAFAEQDEEE